jgi:hypothetical protein
MFFVLAAFPHSSPHAKLKAVRHTMFKPAYTAWGCAISFFLARFATYSIREYRRFSQFAFRTASTPAYVVFFLVPLSGKSFYD